MKNNLYWTSKNFFENVLLFRSYINNDRFLTFIDEVWEKKNIDIKRFFFFADEYLDLFFESSKLFEFFISKGLSLEELKETEVTYFKTPANLIESITLIWGEEKMDKITAKYYKK